MPPQNREERFPGPVFDQELVDKLQHKEPLGADPGEPFENEKQKPLSPADLAERYYAGKNAAKKFERGRTWAENVLGRMYALQHEGQNPPESDAAYEIEAENKFQVLLGFYLNNGVHRFDQFWHHSPDGTGFKQKYRRGFLFEEIVKYDPTLIFNRLPHDWETEEQTIANLREITQKRVREAQASNSYIIWFHYPDALATQIHTEVTGDGKRSVVEAVAEIKASLGFPPEKLKRQLNGLLSQLEVMRLETPRGHPPKKYVIVPKNPFMGDYEAAWQSQLEKTKTGRYFNDWQVVESCFDQNDLWALEQILTGQEQEKTEPQTEQAAKQPDRPEKFQLGEIITKQLVKPDRSFIDWLTENEARFSDLDIPGGGSAYEALRTQEAVCFPGESMPTYISIKPTWTQKKMEILKLGENTRIQKRPDLRMLKQAFEAGQVSCGIKHLEDGTREISLYILRHAPSSNIPRPTISLKDGQFTIEDIYQTPSEFLA